MNDLWINQIAPAQKSPNAQATVILDNAFRNVFPQMERPPGITSKLKVIADMVATYIQADSNAALPMAQDSELIRLVSEMIVEGVNNATASEGKSWSKELRAQKLPIMKEDFWKSVNDGVAIARNALTNVASVDVSRAL